MNLNSAAWDRILAQSVTRAGVYNQNQPLSCPIDHPFHWREFSTHEWSGEQAFQRLGIKRIEEKTEVFLANGIGAYACVDGIALSPVLHPEDKVRALAHEMGHMLLKHPVVAHSREEYVAMAKQQQELRPIQEFEAESVAILVSFALGESEASLATSRGYIQYFLRQPMNGTLPTSWDHVKRAAQQILSAGALVRPTSQPRATGVQTVQGFAPRIKWHSR